MAELLTGIYGTCYRPISDVMIYSDAANDCIDQCFLVLTLLVL